MKNILLAIVVACLLSGSAFAQCQNRQQAFSFGNQRQLFVVPQFQQFNASPYANQFLVVPQFIQQQQFQNVQLFAVPQVIRQRIVIQQRQRHNAGLFGGLLGRQQVIRQRIIIGH